MEGETWRLFTAVLLAPDAVAAVRRRLEEVRAADPALAETSGLRWVAAARWHLTLVFLGAVAADRVPDVATACDRAAHESPAFEWAVAGSGAFPSPRKPHVVWLGFDGDLTRARRLFRSVRREVRQARVRVERRPYQPHVTIGRVRGSSAAPEARRLLAAMDDFRGPTEHTTEIVLLRSHTGPEPRYERLGSFPLGA